MILLVFVGLFVICVGVDALFLCFVMVWSPFFSGVNLLVLSERSGQ